MTARLLIADSNPALCRSLSMLVKATPDVDCVGTAQSSEELLTLADETAPHLVLLAPDLLEASARALHMAHPGIKLIALLRTVEPWDMDEAHAAGAIGCICQEASNENIQAAIAAAYHAQPLLREQVSIQPTNPATFFHLSRDERALLRRLAEAGAQVTSDADRLTLGSLLTKLGAQSLPQAVETAQRGGLLAE